MFARKRFEDLVLKVASKLARQAETDFRDRHNVDIVLAAALQRAKPTHPVAYVETLRGCLEPKRLRIQTIKTGSPDPKFTTLVDALGVVPPVPARTAEDIARVADGYRSNETPYPGTKWAGDVRAHFEISSSFGLKGRILSAAVRFRQPQTAVELGTAYGLSAMFMLEASPGLRLTTVELGDLQYGLSSKLLTERYGARVTCIHGSSEKELGKLPTGSVDLVFHDAGHSRETYLTDFAAMLPALRPNAFVLIDDIRWDHPMFTSEPARTYEGWREVVAHPRVADAVELEGAVGLLRVA